MASKLIISKATKEDLHELSDLFNQYRVFYEQASDLEAAKAFLAERMELNESVIFIARLENSDHLVAAGFTQLYPMFTSIGMKRKWILNDLFVTDAARRKGVAAALMTAVIDFAKSIGAAALSLETGKTNVQAQPLYEKLGFKLDTEYLHYDLKL